jgi:hypothetical protein
MKRKIYGASATISKGYRLRPETHKLIMKLQKKIKGTKDDTISQACGMLHSMVINANKNKT